MNNKNRSQENGYALLTTLLVIILVTVIGLSVMTMSMNTMRLTKGERDNQSSYYIAEAGLVEKRAQINEIAKQVYQELKAEYDALGTPSEKKNFKLEDKFIVEVQKRVENLLVLTENQQYAQQYADSPESIVTVTTDPTAPLKFKITSIGNVPSDNGSSKEKTVSQTVEIKTVAPASNETIEIPGENTVQKLRACFAIQTSDSISINNGTVNGNIYTELDFNIPNGWPTINGSVIAKRNVNVSGGVIEENIVSHNDILINAWMSIKGNIVAKNNIIVKDGPANLSGKFIYGRSLNFEGNYNRENDKEQKKEFRRDIDEIIASYPSTVEANCMTSLPKLPNENSAFPMTSASTLKDTTIKNKKGNSHQVIKDGKLNINNYVIRSTVNEKNPTGKEEYYTLELKEDVYFKEININEDLTLKIDLKNQNRKIYVDDFNNLQGHLELINPGSLEIIVQNSFESKGKINLGNSARSSNLTIRYAGSSGVFLTGESDINGSFYIKRAPTLNIANIGNSGIRGDLIIFGETSVKFGGGASVTENLILAPKSTVTLENGASVKGNIISKRVVINNNGTVTPPLQNSGEWEVPGSVPEIIEVPLYDNETNFLFTTPLIEE